MTNPTPAANLTHTQKCRLALEIAHRSRTWEQACRRIIERGLAEDKAEADSLIYEAEEGYC